MKYLVGTLCGGLMESPAFYFDKPYQFVEAESEQEAIEIYNKAMSVVSIMAQSSVESLGM